MTGEILTYRVKMTKLFVDEMVADHGKKFIIDMVVRDFEKTLDEYLEKEKTKKLKHGGKK